MKLNLELAQAVLDKWYPTPEDKLAACIPNLARDKEQYITNYPLQLIQVDTPSSAAATICLQMKNYGNFLSFTLDYYPACCGIMMFHSFRVVGGFAENQEFINEFMDALLPLGNPSALGASNRVEVIMVEDRDNRLNHRNLESAKEEVVPAKNPNMVYPAFFKYFHTKTVRTRLMCNSNTGNILHNMEVLF